MPGPPPKRDAERRRVNARPVETISIDVAELASHEIEIPEPHSEWHPAAYEWYMSLTKSGQAMYYEPSDWMVAWVVAEDISRQLEPQSIIIDLPGGGQEEVIRSLPMNGAKLTSFIKAAAALMATESERRRLAIEIERKRPGDEIEHVGPDIAEERRLTLVPDAG